MNQFTAKYADDIAGTLSGFDRLLLGGTLRPLSYAQGMSQFLNAAHVRLLDFGAYIAKTTARVRAASEAAMRALGRPVIYLSSSQDSKEERARCIAREEGITQGPICVLACVEPCRSFALRGNPSTKRLEIRLERRKCVHLYHYAIHPLFGFMYARLQTWFPFGLQIYINGHEWLARQMDAAGVSYVRSGNCFVHIDDFGAAQTLFDAQLAVNWPQALQEIREQVHPLHDELLSSFRTDYYWSIRESELSTDILFRDAAKMRRLYPLLLEHAMTALSSGDVLRFLGRCVPEDGRVPSRFGGEVTTDLKTRAEGVRIKHWVNHNSVKMYDKAHTPEGTLLRIETTIYNESDFRVYRALEGAPDGPKQWRPLRRGVADIYRRAQVSQRANERYLDALVSVDDEQTLGEVLQTVITPTVWKGKRVRALHPFDPDDQALLQAVGCGEFTINGLRNRDLQRLLYATETADPIEARRRSAACTRKIRMLRAHGILAKVPHTHRYEVTTKGRTILTALLAARRTPINQLLKAAA